ncbi:Crp/Fnr family transcriptional regulator [Pallidibacillus pasinlerensis]|uniref:Crp/Fnr family transcriptional regulator n=1 Tax=Pallidibacillus pasinlerensis TaxID=2703818 RepID=A0ABX0A9N1_9BACI|nr:Crp/Fnr family transcriptional regulator [Pallidibacillus pasinlerensis]NCU17827.1 Crp/Fnr family transcriptional regulator [Pallidibacillus pasinlerensis]
MATKKKIHKDTFLFYHGQDAKEIYLIKSGIVQISMNSSEGEEMALRICKTDDIVGELTLYTDDPKYLLNAHVMEPGEVLVINIKKLQKELMRNHNLAIEMMKWINNHMRRLQSKMRDLLLNGKRGALYSTLIRLSNSYGVKQDDGILIDIQLTNQEIARFCGATREYVNRLLNELKRKGILTMEPSGKIVIKDINYLRRENQCENCPIEICNMD